MAIIGNFSEFPLPEIFNLIGKRTGKMRLFDLPIAGAISIDIIDGSIVGVETDGRPILKSEEVLATLCLVLESECGMFQFELAREERLSGGLHLPIDQLALDLCCAVDEHAYDTQRMMAREQVFQLVHEADTWMEPELGEFLHTMRGHLQQGVNVEDTGRITGLLPTEALQRLVKLRELGVVDVVEHAPEPVAEPRHAALSPYEWRKKTQVLPGRPSGSAVVLRSHDA